MFACILSIEMLEAEKSRIEIRSTHVRFINCIFRQTQYQVQELPFRFCYSYIIEVNACKYFITNSHEPI